MAMIFVTGGAGFIGANFILSQHQSNNCSILNIDKLTYAGRLCNLDSLKKNSGYYYEKLDVCNQAALERLFEQYRPSAVVHFAAETHVDRSIVSAQDFVQSNVLGTYSLLAATVKYWNSLSHQAKSEFRFLQVSTDEVYGDLGAEPAFTELAPLRPSNPYSATKAAGDHLVRAFSNTYGLPTLTVRCTNNFGPMQLAEKLIPSMVTRAVMGKELPLYGDGLQVRDWLYVQDCCDAIAAVLAKGLVGEIYNVGARTEKTNLEVVSMICRHLDQVYPRPDGRSYLCQVQFVADRPGHDRRYALDTHKIQSAVGWFPKVSFESGLVKTINWYLEKI